ncbi:MAG: 16S rRNA (cytidine(1402)-2'-O)-methyltransferase, partial [Muribaculaceae bacterium]
CNYFVFEGFLPPKKGRETRLRLLADDPRTFIIYESPLRLVKTLQQLAEFCGGDRPASVSREISKVHETTVRGSLSELVEYFTTNNPRGEIVIIVGGKPEPAKKVHTNKYRNADTEQ